MNRLISPVLFLGTAGHLPLEPNVSTIRYDVASAKFSGMDKTVQVDLWHPRSATRTGALITSSRDGRDAGLLLSAPELGMTLTASGRDLFDALQPLRLQLEPMVWFPLCNGRFPLVGLFEPAPPGKVGTVAEQDAYFKRWISGPKARD